MSNYGLQQIFESSVSAVVATNTIQLGTKRYQDGREYMYVYNRSVSTALVGRAMARVGSTVPSSTSGFSGVISTATNVNDILGVVVHANIPPSYYGWVCTKGVCPHALLATASTGILAGAPVRLQLSGKFQKCASGTYPVGVAMNTVASGGTFSVYINA